VGFQGSVAWVTGGGRGIGRAAAHALARAGCPVAVSARTKSELESTVQACEDAGGRALAAPCDVTKRSTLEKAYGAIAKSLGAPLILVNGAGIARSAPFLKTDEALMESHWRLNVLGTFHATQVALPKMLEARFGRVVNVASVAGKAGAPYIGAYAASKHAVLGLTRSLALEVAKNGVTVNAVCPGYVDTKMTEENVGIIVEKTGMSRADALARLKAASPLGRLMTPDEVASAILYLCQDAAAGINGQALTIDGGALQW